jgi:hypothetical protein
MAKTQQVNKQARILIKLFPALSKIQWHANNQTAHHVANFEIFLRKVAGFWF